MSSIWLRARVVLLAALGLKQRAMRCVADALRCEPDNGYWLATWAHWLAEDGDFSGARDALLRCVAFQPGRAQGWFNLGYVCERLGLVAEAESAFQRATELDARLDRAWYGLALALIAQDRLGEAVAALKVNTALQPMSPHGWYQMGRVHADLGAPEEARRVIDHLRQFEPKIAAQLARDTGLCA